jgi:hypothetical protein
MSVLRNPGAGALALGLLDAEKQADFDWLSDVVRHTPTMIVLNGYLVRVAFEHPDWTYWQVLHEAREKFVKIHIT